MFRATDQDPSLGHFLARKEAETTPAAPLAEAAGEGETTVTLEEAVQSIREHQARVVAALPQYEHNTFIGVLLEYLDKQGAETATLRARLAEETRAAAEAEREKLALHEELRGLRADVSEMNSQIGAAHRITGEWIAECGKRTEGRKAAEQGLTDFRELTLAGLKEAWGQGDWLNIHHMIEELKAKVAAAALPLVGDGKEGAQS